ncbi:MAG: SDR family oxidoreductase [Pseudomonadota bacterium]
MARLDGMKALITGAASGFGEGIAHCFAREGAAVMVADIDGDGAARVAADLVAKGAKAEALEADIADEASMASAVATTENAFGGLSVLVANAGIGQRPARASETPMAEMQRQFTVNAMGAAVSCQAALPALRRHGAGASIVMTVSAIALTPRPEFCAYGMAKSAASYFMKSLALDLAPEGIRVNGLFPAVSDTPMFEEFSGGDMSKAGAFAAALPMGRLITPNDVGEAAVFLASPTEAGAMTGCALPVDVGRTI